MEEPKMSEIAQLKWFNTTHNDQYKLECEDGSSYYFSGSEIHCSEQELRRGRFITFEVEGKTLKNLRLLQEIGTMEWYRSDKGFGVARLLRNDLNSMFASSSKGCAEVFVHINQVCFGSENIEEGSLIVFGIKTSRRYSYSPDKPEYREDATQVKLLTQETDREIIERCANSDDVNVVLAVRDRYLDNLESIDQKVSWVLEKINNFPDNKQNKFADSLPNEILLSSPEIREFLTSTKYIEILVELIEKDDRNEGLNTILLLSQLKEKLESYSVSLNSHDIWDKIPDWILLNTIFWSLIPSSRCNTIIKAQLKDELTYNKGIDLLYYKLKNHVNDDRSFPLYGIEYSSLLYQISSQVKREPQIFSFLSDSEKASLLVEQFQQPEERENAVDALANLLHDVAEKKSCESYDSNHQFTQNWSLIINRLPDFVKKHEKIFPYLSPEDKISILSSYLEDTLSQVIEVISQVSLSVSQQKLLIHKLPEWIREAPLLRSSLWQILPATSRSDTSEVEEIKKFVTERKIDCLCHFTTLENLQGICREGGILSIHQLSIRDISGYNQIDEGRWDGKLNHICCSINSYNSMYLYHAKSRHQTQGWVLLAIKPDYLWKQKTLFCPINAASGCGAYIKKGLAGLQSLYKPVVSDINGRQYTRQGLEDYQPTCIQAEVQVYASIALDDILFIWVDEYSGREEKVREAGWKGAVKIWRGLFR
jgi:cold shock CspA family protein